jgi:transposase
LLKLVDMLTEEIDKVTPRIAALAAADPVSRRLMTHPGVGPVTAVYLPLVIGDPHRFKTGKAFANYLGLVPSEYSSAEKRRLGAVTKQGNRLARWLLVEAGRSAVQYDPDLQRFYRRVAQRKGRPKAMVAVARKLAIRLLLMWKRGKDYQQWIADAPHACRQARREA